MAIVKVPQLVCDRPKCGRAKGTETRTVVEANGRVWQLELCPPHRAWLDRQTALLIETARFVSGPRLPDPPPPPPPAGNGNGNGNGHTEATDIAELLGGAELELPPSNAEIRHWARQGGLKVNDQGKIPAAILEAYNAAHDLVGAAQ